MRLTHGRSTTPRSGLLRRCLAPLAILVAAITVVEIAPVAAQVRDPIPMPRLRPGGPSAGANAVFANDVPAPRPGSRFSHAQQITLHNINRYFNSFRLMEGEFIQFGPSGEQSEGVFFLNRPGKVRFRYSPPSRLDIIADGSTVAIRNTRAQTQDMYPLSQTPLRYLLADRIDLTDEQLVSSIREEPDLVSLVIVDRTAAVEGQITLIFDRRTYELRQWVVTDAQGLNTSVAIYNTTTGKRQKGGMFFISPTGFN